MFRRMAVGKKIILGFTVVLVLLVAIGGIAYEALRKASDGFTQYREMARDANLAGRLQANMLMVRMNVKDFIITGSDKDLKEYHEYIEKMEGFIEEAQKEIQNTERAAKIDAVHAMHNEYALSFEKVAELKHERNKVVNEVLNVKGPLMEKTLTTIMESASSDADLTAAYHSGLAMKHLLLGRVYMAKFLDSNDQKAVDRVHEEFGKMQEKLAILDEELENPERRKMLSTIIEAKGQYVKTFDNLVNIIFDRNKIIIETLDRIGPLVAKDVEAVKLSIKKVQDDLGPKLVASNTRSVTVIIVIAVTALLLGSFLAFVITRAITKPLSRIIEGLNEGSDQVASASGQVSSASQQMAEGTSEQAASLEETSSSLEEMSSMTKQNAGNAEQADNLMKEANLVVGQANNSMNELNTSMGEISKASEDTFKIIKTIDEIAFQTNLLALNAAVEAARAGEAGAGFAVVADEVRNLAMRAADAAKNTANLIEGTVKKVKDGGDIVNRTSEAFEEVAKSTAKVGELVAEISMASNEQSRGHEQLNKAVAELDKVVQQNAANAEENASASEEMNSQAEQMKGFVGELMALATGNRNGSNNGHAGKVTRHGMAIRKGKHLAAPSGKSGKMAAVLPKTKEIHPEQMIPLDKDDFGDF